MAWFWQQFAPEGLVLDGRAVPLDHPDLTPLLAHDLHVLPLTLVVTAPGARTARADYGAAGSLGGLTGSLLTSRVPDSTS